MKLTEEDRKLDLTDYLGGEYREDYSGRGMFGKVCEAWDYDTEREAVLDMIDAVASSDDDVDALQRIFNGYEIDAMGRAVVLYFPKRAHKLAKAS